MQLDTIRLVEIECMSLYVRIFFSSYWSFCAEAWLLKQSNHKDAIDFILDVPNLTVGRIEEIHALLTKELGVERNIRHRRVGITGTNYTPPDNEFQIREALEDTVTLIKSKTNIFEKALLALVLMSYIQAFTDGNKRTARIVSNGILIANGYCPISFRTVDSVDYKKAMLMFYEQNNIAAHSSVSL